MEISNLTLYIFLLVLILSFVIAMWGSHLDTKLDNIKEQLNKLNKKIDYLLNNGDGKEI